MTFHGFVFQISNAYYPRQVIQIGPNNVTVNSSKNFNGNGQKWTFWHVYSDNSYVIRNYPSGRFLGLSYHGELVGVNEDVAIHWEVQPSGYDPSTWVIRMKKDTFDRVLTLTEADGAVILDYADSRRGELQEWRLKDTGYHWPSEDSPLAEFIIESEETMDL
ncbi:hypothetical protein E4T56_gene2767 [Termitomyces sp. T112]|nr:hypothetical protein E4T56_gene2767 [Termitomyces sp. T112]